MSLLPRDRLSEALQLCAARGVAFVVAPPGYGKSEAIHDAFGDIGLFVSLHEERVTFEDLAKAIVSAANRRELKGLIAFLQRPTTDTKRDDAEIASWIAHRLRGIEAPIVLDDFQRANGDERVSNLVSRLIELTAPSTRWLIVCRETPTLPIGTWMARGWAALPLLAEDLAFSLDEARELADRLGANIGTDDLATIVAETEGWPLLVRITLSAWDETRAILPLRIRTRSLLFDFFEKQIWGSIPAGDKEVLYALAILGQARPGMLAQAGLPNVVATLTQLEERIPLVRRGPNGEHRMHETFRDFLNERHIDPQASLSLATKFIDVARQLADFTRALQLAIETQNWDIALAILGEHGPALVEEGDRALVAQTMGALPAKYQQLPSFLGVRGLLFALDGKTAAADADLTAALTGDLHPRLRAQVTFRLAQIALTRGDAERGFKVLEQRGDCNESEELEAQSFLAAAKGLRADVDGTLSIVKAVTQRLNGLPSNVRARILQRLAIATCHIGDYPAAERHALAAADLAEAGGLPAVASRAYSVLLNVAGMLYSDLAMAAEYAASCVRAAKDAGERDTYALGLTAQISVAVERGADETYEEASSQLRKLQYTTSPWHDVILRWARAVHDVGLGRFRQARLALTTYDRSTYSQPAQAFLDSLLALVHIANEEPDNALPILDRAVLTASDTDLFSQRELMFAAAYRNLGYWLLHRSRLARRTLNTSSSVLPEPDQLVLSVIQSICTTPRETMTERKLELFTDPLVASDMQGHVRFLMALCQPAILPKPALTPSELEVLRQVRLGGSTQEISRRLGRSPRTIDNHITEVCRKVGCRGRAEAVMYAIDQGWLQ